MYELPTSIQVNNRIYNIRNRGDFRVILDCFAALKDDEMGEDTRVLASLIIFYENFEDIEDLPDGQELQDLVKNMFWFMSNGKEDEDSSSPNTPLIDWEQDSQIICAAVNNVANTEIRSLPYLHWWTFLGYYMSVGQSVLSTVVGIRDKLVRGKKLEKWEKDFKREHPQYFNWRKIDSETAELDKMLRENFHGGKK